VFLSVNKLFELRTNAIIFSNFKLKLKLPFKSPNEFSEK